MTYGFFNWCGLIDLTLMHNSSPNSQITHLSLEVCGPLHDGACGQQPCWHWFKVSIGSTDGLALPLLQAVAIGETLAREDPQEKPLHLLHTCLRRSIDRPRWSLWLPGWGCNCLHCSDLPYGGVFWICGLTHLPLPGLGGHCQLLPLCWLLALEGFWVNWLLGWCVLCHPAKLYILVPPGEVEEYRSSCMDAHLW